MTTVLLTAFEAFDGETINPSLEAARAVLQAGVEGAGISLVELPVDRRRAIEVVTPPVLGAPDVVIMLGEAGGRFRVSPERIAINVDDFRIPDNAGNQPLGEPIVEGGPAAYFSKLPIKRIVERLNENNIPAAISNSAGTYLCNRVFYSVMNLIAERSLPSMAGFIHLPYLHEQAIPKQRDFPSLSRETLIRAVVLAVEESLASSNRTQSAPGPVSEVR
jgi:pyroglutamyl-peptidase